MGNRARLVVTSRIRTVVVTTRSLLMAEVRIHMAPPDDPAATSKRPVHTRPKIHMVHLGVLDEATTKRLLTRVATPTHMARLAVLDGATTRSLRTAEVRTHMAL